VRRLGHAAAAVVAQVEHEARHPLLLQPVERRVQVVGDAVAHERGDAHVAGGRVEHRRHGDRRRVARALAPNAPLDPRERAVLAPPLEA
jgi:hypothetical protein